MTFEDQFLARLFARLPMSSSGTIVGPGDDAAVLVPANGALVATTDALVEGVHFDLAFCLPEEIGARAIQINLSDLAAQGAKPKYVLISLIVPPHISQTDLLRFNEGVSKVLSVTGAELVGGNVSKTSGPFVVSVTALGEPFPGVSPYATPQRGTAQVGDWLAVTGPLGLAATGLQALKIFGRAQSLDLFPLSVQRYLVPQARIRVAEKLLNTGAVTSMMDISDGLSLDLTRLRGSTHLDFVLNKEALRPHPEISGFVQRTQQRLPTTSSFTSNGSGANTSWPNSLKQNSKAQNSTKLNFSEFDLMLNHGDDYELVLTLNPELWMRAVAENLDLKDLVHVIGEVEEDIKERVSVTDRSGLNKKDDSEQISTSLKNAGLWIRSKDDTVVPIQPQGWDHLPS